MPERMDRLKPETIALLTEVGVCIHHGGLAPTDNDINAACAIWAWSEEPTPQEIQLIGEIAHERTSGREIIGTSVKGIAMVTFKKLRDRSWTFRYSDWGPGNPPWSYFHGILSDFLFELRTDPERARQ